MHRETVGMVTILWPCLCRSIKNLNYFIINSRYYFQFLIFESFLPFSQIIYQSTFFNNKTDKSCINRNYQKKKNFVFECFIIFERITNTNTNSISNEYNFEY
ncbi:unnamed protein product [Rhizophagus irregularis]|nr:unnamed protein product [Rhizophagus irregularis]CAB5353662.1 unnamed protein product [Rhizophagus irregularis]